jgi:hypothetical protein
MPAPIEKFTAKLDEILSRHDLSHDFGRKMAHEEAVEYARQNLLEDPHCEDFLQLAAKRLGFAPVSFDTIESRVKMQRGAWLDVWISDEDDEIALTGTREGLQYLIDILTQLKGSTIEGEHVHLDRGILPMTDNSANLVLFREEETWFTGSPEGGESFPERDVNAESVFAIQVLQYPPEGLPITPHRIYRVTSVTRSPDDAQNVKDFPEGAPERYFTFTFRSDAGQSFSYGFHLDDPAVNFFTHREIMALVMKPTE